MSVSLKDLLVATQARKVLEEIIRLAVATRQKIILQKQEHEKATPIGARFYNIVKETIIHLANTRPDLRISILDYEAFAFCIGSRAFQIRFCRELNDKINSKRFSKVELELTQQDLFDTVLNPYLESLEEINETHIYLVFKANAESECYGASLNAYVNEELIEQESFDYLIRGEDIPVILIDMNTDRKEAKEISSAGDDLGLKGDEKDTGTQDM